ncbi:hypothetical protein UTI89_C2662 [Escherichia coli UTI89]|uniref:Uncharacterized protein n=1 Tax=Escherichia coli (strain UTI89 / UPEC) TaxID=364106 RepID=Q1R936_ECOUT|nr:hypothetical protein UTI89_C2662 [Escherichia coli UTI89]
MATAQVGLWRSVLNSDLMTIGVYRRLVLLPPLSRLHPRPALRNPRKPNRGRYDRHGVPYHGPAGVSFT